MKIRMARIGNPWITDEYEVDEDLAQKIADEVAAACEGYSYSNSYNYDRHATPVLKNYLIEAGTIDDQRALVRAVELKLEAMSDYSSFHQGANAARKCVGSFGAYMNPDFAEAKRYQAMHG